MALRVAHAYPLARRVAAPHLARCAVAPPPRLRALPARRAARPPRRAVAPSATPKRLVGSIGATGDPLGVENLRRLAVLGEMQTLARLQREHSTHEQSSAAREELQHAAAARLSAEARAEVEERAWQAMDGASNNSRGR